MFEAVLALSVVFAFSAQSETVKQSIPQDWLQEFEAEAVGQATFDKSFVDLPSLAPLSEIGREPCPAMFTIADPHPSYLVGATVILIPSGDYCHNSTLLMATYYVKADANQIAELARKLTDDLGKQPTDQVVGANRETRWQISPRRAVVIGKDDIGGISLTFVQAPAAH